MKSVRLLSICMWRRTSSCPLRGSSCKSSGNQWRRLALSLCSRVDRPYSTARQTATSCAFSGRTRCLGVPECFCFCYRRASQCSSEHCGVDVELCEIVLLAHKKSDDDSLTRVVARDERATCIGLHSHVARSLACSGRTFLGKPAARVVRFPGIHEVDDINVLFFGRKTQ